MSDIIDRTRKNTMYQFTIDQTVRTTEYFYPEFSISKFMSNLGGILGLWLGIGAMQFLDLLIAGFEYIKSAFHKI